jgi:hypothetical protein
MACYENTQNSMSECEHHDQIKIARTTEGKCGQTYPGVVDPFPLVGGAGPKIQIGPMSKDPVDPGVDLSITQLLREGTAETTWP